MRFIADFHLHSKYSRATSPQMELETLDKAAKTKGIQVLGTGDFTHPEWLKHLKEKLSTAEQGLFKLKNNSTGTRFMLTAEISCIYSKNSKVRKIHILVFTPSFEAVDKINTYLNLIGNLKSDGRPILGLDAKELAKIVLSSCEDCLVVPAHCFTPWFSLFGSKSGFDSLAECFEEYSKYIYAGETGLSADPTMFWRIPDGRRLTLISNGDAHSPAKIGREANVFDTELSYNAIIKVIKDKDKTRFLETIEFFPEEGKYHYDGHRSCNVCFDPNQTKKHNGICPNCGRPLVIGVLNRAEQLADKPEGFKPADAIPFRKLIPLVEIIGETLDVGPASKKVAGVYNQMIKDFGSEFAILLDIPISELKSKAGPEIVEAISRVRQGKVNVEPGYDGVYGRIKIFSETEKKDIGNQKSLF